MIDINNGDDIDEKSAAEIAEETPSLFDDRMLAFAKMMNTNRAGILKTAGYEISLTNPIAFLEHNYRGRPIFRYIQSHPDLDHMRGLAALRDYGIPILNFWDTDHDKTPDFMSESDEDDWTAYESLQAGTWNGTKHTVLRLARGSTGQFYNRNEVGMAGGDGIHIIAPTPELNASANESGNSNNLSYVLWLEYRGIKIVLGGDAEDAVWQNIFE
ncbi:MAG: hypothetical protein JNM43_21235, partial [Planctomycetaceae bacterium]|nr:hypothetical protein [Planctomycetaceae bacterium]